MCCWPNPTFLQQFHFPAFLKSLNLCQTASESGDVGFCLLLQKPEDNITSACVYSYSKARSWCSGNIWCFAVSAPSFSHLLHLIAIHCGVGRDTMSITMSLYIRYGFAIFLSTSAPSSSIKHQSIYMQGAKSLFQ